jgi:hypothetical protein
MSAGYFTKCDWCQTQIEATETDFFFPTYNFPDQWLTLKFDSPGKKPQPVKRDFCSMHCANRFTELMK